MKNDFRALCRKRYKIFLKDTIDDEKADPLRRGALL